jgi:nitrogen fixation/metabolism regulation signal transduction histidine kinase
MKKLLWLTLLVSIVILLLNRSESVTWVEAIVMTIASCIISITIGQGIKLPRLFVCFITFGLCFIVFLGFLLFDLIVDHYMYFLLHAHNSSKLSEKLNAVRIKVVFVIVGSFSALLSSILSAIVTKAKEDVRRKVFNRD